jgi:hypothetical protein
MPQVVNMYLGQPQLFQQPIKAPSNGVGPQLGTLLCAKDEIMMLPGWTGSQAHFLLPAAVGEEDIHHRLREQDDPLTRFCLGISHHKLAILCERQGMVDRKRPQGKVNILPTQG